MEKILFTLVLFQYACVTFGAIITKGPSDVVANELETVQFTCETSKASNLFWYLNGFKVLGKEYLVSKNLQTYTLKVKDVTSSDSGIYTCRITDDQGDVIKEESKVAYLKVRYRKVKPRDFEVFTRIGIRKEKYDMIKSFSSYPEMTNLKVYRHGKPLEDNENKTIKYRSVNKVYKFRYVITVKFTSLSESDFGEYDLKYDYEGKPYEVKFGNLIRIKECSDPDSYFLCSNLEKCVMKGYRTCDNKDDCGDMSDEINCPAPKNVPESLTVRHRNFNSLEVNFYEIRPYYEVLVNATDDNGIVVSQKVAKRGLLVTGLRQNTTYAITAQFISISGVLGKPLSIKYHIPVRAVPKTPKLLEVSHRKYNTIYLSIGNTQTDDTDYSTIVSTTDQNGNKVGEDISKRMFKTFVYVSIGGGKLQNGITYYIKVQLENSVGKAIPLFVNYTIPRMTSPGPVRNLTMKVIKNDKRLNIQVSYLRPTDDGGFGKMFLRGTIKKCVVTSKKLLIRCETKNNLIGYGGQETTNFFGLEGNTEYYFEVTYRSEEGQVGKSVSKYFKTPPINYPVEETGLSTPVIIGIVVACLFVLSSLCACIYKCCCIDSSGVNDQVVYHAADKEEI